MNTTEIQNTILEQVTYVLKTLVKPAKYVLIDGEKTVHFDFKNGRSKTRISVTYNEGQDLYEVKKTVMSDLFTIKSEEAINEVHIEDLQGIFAEA